MRGSPTGRIEFNNCHIQPDLLVGQPGQATKILMQGLNFERLVLCGGPLGIMEACFDLIGPHLVHRNQFGQSLGALPAMQAKIADLYTEYRAASSLVYATAQRFDQQQVNFHDSTTAYLHCARTAVKIALETIQILGAKGYMRSCHAGRLLNDAKLYELVVEQQKCGKCSLVASSFVVCKRNK